MAADPPGIQSGGDRMTIRWVDRPMRNSPLLKPPQARLAALLPAHGVGGSGCVQWDHPGAGRIVDHQGGDMLLPTRKRSDNLACVIVILVCAHQSGASADVVDCGLGMCARNAKFRHASADRPTDIVEPPLRNA